MNIKICTVDSKWQADKIVNDLQSKGIESIAIFKPRDYSAIVAGSSSEMYDIFVTSDNYEAAMHCIQLAEGEKHNAKQMNDEVVVGNQSEERKLFKRVVFFSVCCVMFPILFFIIAWINYQNYIKIAEDQNKLLLARLAILFGFLISLFYIYMYLSSAFKSSL